MKILLWPHPTLKKISEPVAEVTDDIKQLVSDMHESMKIAGGVGLSAVQIGVLKQVIVADVGKGLQVYLNLKVKSTQPKVPMLEGCLSLPGFFDTVRRYESIDIEYDDLQMQHTTETVDGLLGHVLQHEHDHMKGVLFVDFLTPARRQLIRGNMRKYK